MFHKAPFEAVFNSFDVLVKSFLGWVATAPASAAKETMERLEVKASRRNLSLRISQVLRSENLALCKFGTEQINQVHRAPPPVRTDALKDSLI